MTGYDALGSFLAVVQGIRGRTDAAKQAAKGIVDGWLYRDESPVLVHVLSGQPDRAMTQIEKHAYVRNYRWVISEPLLRRYRKSVRFQELVRTLHEEWKQNLRELGARIPSAPPDLPPADEYFK